MINDIFDCCCLFQCDSKGTKFIVMMHPEEFDFLDNFPIIMNNVFPDNLDPGFFIFNFTIPGRFVYVMKFPGINTEYAFAFITKYSFHSLFQSFLESIKNAVISGINPLSINDLFMYCYTLLKSWDFFDKNTLHAVYYDNEFDIDISTNSDNEFNYNPFLYVYDEKRLWNSIISGERICVVGSDPLVVSKCASSLSFLTFPFEYKGDILISLSHDDARTSSDKTSQIVGTTCEEMVDKSEFAIVIDDLKEKPDAEIVLRRWKEKAKKFEFLVSHIMTLKAIENPFFELLGGTPADVDIKSYMKHETSLLIPSVSAIAKFCGTKTYKEWNMSRRYRSEMRDSLMNISPETEYNKLSLEELMKYKEALSELTKIYSEDKHMVHVLRRHIAIINEEAKHR